MSLLLIISSFAQIKKGLWLVDAGIGNFGFGKGKSQDVKPYNGDKSISSDFQISFYPRIGYFVSKKIAVGSGLYFYYSNSKSEYIVNYEVNSKYKNINSSLSISPFIRYYIPLKNEMTNFYFHIGGGYGFTILSKGDATYYLQNGEENGKVSYSNHYNNFFGEGSVGLNQFINTHIALNASIGYSYSQYKSTSNGSYSFNNATTNHNESKWYMESNSIMWNIGLSIFISKNKDEKKSE